MTSQSQPECQGRRQQIRAISLSLRSFPPSLTLPLLLHNFFHPNLKLLSKTRKGSKTLRKYSPPQTPYQRLLQSEHLSQEQKQKLQSQFQQLNPLRLKEQIEQKLKMVFDKARAR